MGLSTITIEIQSFSPLAGDRSKKFVIHLVASLGEYHEKIMTQALKNRGSAFLLVLLSAFLLILLSEKLKSQDPRLTAAWKNNLKKGAVAAKIHNFP